MRYKIITALLSLIALVSCSEAKLEDGVSITEHPRYIGNLALSFPNAGDNELGATENRTATLYVDADDTGWEISNPASWLSVSPLSGRDNATVTIEAEENITLDARVAILNLRSTDADYGYSRDFKITQKSAAIYVKPSVSAITCSAAAQTKTVTIDSNVDWAASCSADWVSVSKASSKELNIAISENISSTRNATIHITKAGSTDNTTRAGDEMATSLCVIEVVQQEAGVTSETSEMNFTIGGGTQSLNISAESSWSAYTNSSWISVSPEKGNAGTAAISVTATANSSNVERSSYVYVKIGEKQKLAVTVNQEGMKLSVDVASLSFGSGTDTKSFTLDSNSDWKIVSAPEWLSFSPKSGVAATGATIKVTSADNPNTTSRSGQIVVGKDGFSGNKTINVTQEGKNFSDLGDSMHFPNTASTQTLKVSTDGSWSASASDTWIHLSPASGNGEGVISVSVDANPQQAERQGQIAVKVGVTTKQIMVIQVGRYIEISCDNLLTNSKPATINVSISSNIDWKVRSDADWMTPTPASGSGDATISVAVGDNPSAKERTGKIFFENSDGVKELSVTQPGRSLAADCTSLEFVSAGGTSSTVTVTTDGKYSVTTSDSWLAVTENGNTFTVTASANENNESRNGSVVIALTDLTDGSTLSYTIPVVQFGQYYIEVSGNTELNDSKPSKISLSIGSNTDWTVKSEATWMTLDKASGTGTGTINVSVADNPSVKERSDKLIFENSSVRKEVVITQPGRTLSVDQSKIEFNVEGGTSSAVKITTDGKYSIILSDSWMTISQSGDTFTVTASANGTNDTRNGSIVVSLTDLANGETLSETIAVVQHRPKYFEILEFTSLSNSNASTVSVSVDSNTDWTVRTESPWMTLNKDNGSGSGTIDVSVTDNPSVKERVGKLIFECSGGGGAEIKIVQPARTLELDCSSLEFGVAGGTSKLINVATDGTYSITPSDSWITITQTGNAFSVTVPRNESGNSISGSVVVALTDLSNGEILSKTVQIIQLPQLGNIGKDDFGEDENWNL